MADPLDPFSLNVLGATDLVQNRLNKTDGSSDIAEGVVSEKYDAYELSMSDEELLKLRDEWITRYMPYQGRIELIMAANLESYIGKKPNGQWLAGPDNIAANIQFEAEETFLATTLARSPDPVVFADNTPEGNKISSDVKTMLQFHAKHLKLRTMLQMMTRQWSICHLGVLKYGWNKEIDDVEIKTRKIQDFIFDPHGYVDADGHMVGYLGERITVSAEKLIEMFPKGKEYIELTVDGKLGTEVEFTEWWTDEFTFSTFKKKVLDKHKNEFFKYPEEQIDPISGKPAVDEFGLPAPLSEPRNHFAIPRKPYTFLSVYSLQEQPHDITGLIEQNIPNQRLITKRTEQIDSNISQTNNATLYSQNNFNQETAAQAKNALTRGVGQVLVPQGGPISESVVRLNVPSLPAEHFNSLETYKNDLRTSWGVQGITAQPGDEDQTARGMILNQTHDTTRIGGGIGEKISDVAESAFNWLTQLYYVFYDDIHFAAIMGRMKATEYVMLSQADLDRQLIVSVAPDSMKPKDEVNQMNMAQDLFVKGAIGPKTLLTILDFPDPDESAADGLMYKLDPMGYLQLNFPQYAAQLQQQMAQQAMLQAQQGAQAKGMETAAVASNTPPEQTTEPEQKPVVVPSASLNQVPINQGVPS